MVEDIADADVEDHQQDDGLKISSNFVLIEEHHQLEMLMM